MLKSKTILCADIGTSSLKAALIDLEGKLLAFNREAYPQKEIVSSDWEKALLVSIKKIIKNGEKPSAICISGNGPTLVPVTYNGKDLGALHWYDLPKEKNETGERLALLASLPKPKSFFLPYVKYFQETRKAEYEKTQYLFSVQEWLSFKLGAEPVTTLPSEEYLSYYWREEECANLNIDIKKFPPFVKLGSIIGKVSEKAENGFGIPKGIPIVAGGADFIMALIGVGAIEEGLVCDRAGTSEGINLCSSFSIHSKELRVLPHLKTGLWNIGGVIGNSGKLFEWYKTFTGQENKTYEEILFELIPANEILPKNKIFFSSEHGILSERLISRQALGGTVLKTLGFLTRDILDKLKKYGFSVKEMRVSGGQGKNSLWNKLKADITGCDLLIPEISDGELAGNAILGSMALGESSEYSEAVQRMIRIQKCYTPTPERHSQYTEEYSEYCGQKARLQNFFRN